MTETPPTSIAPEEAAPGHTPDRPLAHLTRRLRGRGVGLGLAGIASAVGAIIVFGAATQVAVHATSEPPAPGSVPIPAESTDEDAPEKVAEVAAPPAAQAAYDQMNGDEVSYARHLVGQSEAFASGRDMFGGEGLQFLSADVADPSFSEDGQRRLSLLYYDYGTDELVSFLMNLTTGAVEETDRGQGSQPAPTDAETQLGWELLLADDAAKTALGEQYAELTGGSVLTAESQDVELTAHSFTTDAATFGAESCGVERCVQLLAQVGSGPFLTTSAFVVNLSTQTVLPVS